jgi:hypothetical protein
MEHVDHPTVAEGQTQHEPTIRITLNEHQVVVPHHRMTGLAIKEFAIAQHVPIQIDFVLSEEFQDGKSKIIGDHDTVAVHNGSKFNAVAPDDNS